MTCWWPRRNPSADLVDGDGTRRRRAAGGQRGLARGRLTEAGLQDVAHEDIGHIVRVHSGAGERSLEGNGAQTRRGHAGETTLEASNRRAAGGEDDDVSQSN